MNLADSGDPKRIVQLAADAKPAATTESSANSETEGALHGFPSLRDLSGKKLAEGEFTQSVEDEHLHIKIRYQFSPAHWIEEQAAFRQKPQLAQEQWSWRESKGGTVVRQFKVDFQSGRATAEKTEDKKVKRWSQDVKIEPGRTFAGFGFVLAIKKFREALIKGEKVELKAIGFTPKPRAVSVEITFRGLDQMSMSGRTMKGDRFVIHPKVPAIAKVFVKVPDTLIWLINPPPAGFLRWEGPLVEPGDPVVRVDLLPGTQSGPAEPAK